MSTPRLKLSRDEWAWVLVTLLSMEKKMPGHARHKMCYNATRWDLDDLYRAAFEEACAHREEVWRAVELRAIDGRWPKVKPAVAFWLSARTKAARGFAEAVLAKAKPSDTPPHAMPPADGQSVIKQLLLDYWDGCFVDDWLAENLRDYTYQEPYDLTDEDVAYFQKWLREVEDGKYFQNEE